MGEVKRVPDTFEEMVANYDGFIEAAIIKISRGYVKPQDIGDLKQEIYTRMVDKDYLNLARTRIEERKAGSWTTYLYKLILTVLSNRFDKNTRNPLNMAIGVVESSPADKMETSALVLETYEDLVVFDFEQGQETSDYLNRFERFLGEQSEEWDKPIQFPDGSMHRKSLKLVLRLLRQDLDPKDIAKLLGVTPGSVFSYIKKIKGFAGRFQDAT